MMGIIRTLRFLWTHPLGRRRRGLVLARYLRWQIGARLAPGPVVVPWIGDLQVLVGLGDTGFTGNVYVGLHEFVEMAFVCQFLRPGDLFVDGGANLGSYTLLAAGVAGAEVVAIEPVPATWRRLQYNICLNELGARVRVERVALADEPGELPFTVNLAACNHVRTGEPFDIGDETRVPATTLDRLLGGRRPRALKLDLEGYELPALRGAIHTLAGKAPLAVIVELNGSGRRYGHTDAEVAAMLRDHGLVPVTYDPWSRRLTECDLKDALPGNALFVRGLRAAAERLRTALPLRVLGIEL